MNLLKFSLLFIIFQFFSLTSNAQSYTLTDDDVVVYSGLMVSCSYSFNSKDIVIPNSLDGQLIRNIGSACFKGKGIKSLVLPDSLQYIQSEAFQNNELTQVNIPNSVIVINSKAFDQNNLNKVTIPNSVILIQQLAFGNIVDSLTIDMLIVPHGYYNGFKYVSLFGDSIKYLSLGENVRKIGNNAFDNCQIKSLIIPDSVKNIGSNAFNRNQLSSLTLSKSLITIGRSAFQNNSITALSIPNSVTTIESYAFQNNQISSLTIPNSVTQIGSYAFQNNNITALNLPNSLTTIGSFTFNNNKITTLIIPDSVQAIEPYAFAANSIQKLIIPHSVQTIESGNFDYLSSNTGLDSLFIDMTNIPAGITTFNVTQSVFGSNLKKVILGNNVQTIGSNAFLNNKISRIVLPNSIQMIGANAFTGNSIPDLQLPKIKYHQTLWNGNILGGTIVSNFSIAYNRTVHQLQPDGVYIGLVGFNGNLKTTKDIETNGMLDLNQNGSNRNTLSSFVNNLQQDDNTALYAAMGESVDMLNNAALPKLEEVFVITFTDGLDNFSQNKTPTYTSADIQSLLDTNLVDSLNIQSFTVGFTDGMAAPVKAAFETDLTNLASSPENFFASDSFAEITDYFTFISKQLVKVTEVNRLECKIPGPADNTKVRWTFDITSTTDIDPAQIYIDATVRRNGLVFWLENVSYNGVQSSTGTDSIPGENVLKDGNFDGVKFNFDNFKFNQKCSEGNVSKLKYWTYNQGFSLWVNDIESNAGSISSVGFNRKNIAVMLNLDCSNSLGSQFANIKSIATNFINNLQTDYHSNAATKLITKVNVNPAEQGIDVTFGGVTKSTNAAGEVYFFDLDEQNYSYSSTYKGRTKSGSICVDGIKEISINFSTTEHTVTFEDWDETVLKVEFVETGQSATAPPTPTKTGATFTGWSEDFSNITEDLTVIAQYDDMASSSDISSASSQFSIYPNPAQNTVYIQNKTNEPIRHITILDPMGKLVAEFHKDQINEKHAVVRLPLDVSAGVYILSIATSESISTSRIVKK